MRNTEPVTEAFLEPISGNAVFFTFKVDNENNIQPVAETALSDFATHYDKSLVEVFTLPWYYDLLRYFMKIPDDIKNEILHTISEIVANYIQPLISTLNEIIGSGIVCIKSYLFRRKCLPAL
jgi:hypothetical protein